MYCQHCGSQINDNAVVCPNCGCQVKELIMQPVERPVIGYLALIFGILGGWIGLLMGVIGLATYKEPKNRKNCKIGIGLFVAWIVVYVIIVVVAVITVVNNGNAIDYYSFLPL